MEKSTSTAAQTTTEPPPPSSLPAQDQRSSPAIDLDSSPGAPAQPHLAAQVPTPPSTACMDTSSKGRKRPLEGNLQIENSNYYKMRLLLKDLRPHVLQVLRTPDFRNCKAAIEIREKMKRMLQLYQEMIGETPKRTKSDSLSNGKAINQTPGPSEKQSSDGLVGGSAFGWNFVTYGGTEAVYYGMSKEEYRSSHPITQAG